MTKIFEKIKTKIQAAFSNLIFLNTQNGDCAVIYHKDKDLVLFRGEGPLVASNVNMQIFLGFAALLGDPSEDSQQIVRGLLMYLYSEIAAGHVPGFAAKVVEDANSSE